MSMTARRIASQASRWMARWAATFSKDITDLAGKLLRNPERIEVTPPNTTVERIEAFLNVEPLTWRSIDSQLSSDKPIQPYSHLMTRVDKKQVDALVEANRQSLQATAEAPAAAAANGAAAIEPMADTITIVGSIDVVMPEIDR